MTRKPAGDGLRATPPHRTAGLAASMSLSGRHSGARTTPGSTSSSPSNKRVTPARSRSATFSATDWLSRRTISVCCSVSMSLAGCEIAMKLPGTHASISWCTMAPTSVSSVTNCRTVNSMTATGWLKVQRVRRLGQDRSGVPHIAVDVGAGAFRFARQQRPGVQEHD